MKMRIVLLLLTILLASCSNRSGTVSRGDIILEYENWRCDAGTVVLLDVTAYPFNEPGRTEEIDRMVYPLSCQQMNVYSQMR